MTQTRFEANPECRGVSIANILCGLVGGAPCTGVLVRTAVNVASGATYKYSQFINSVVCLIIIVVLIKVFVYLPMAVIASILMCSACRLIDI